ncbi:hypothetical protein SAMN05192553_10798 [Cyclobacterium xiamenense]|uniref:Uncharacterized protein n=1 Tax=Cyclobacterium xiamenense TaxID=1297121 RepID=A0A1H7AIM9_9BACT|nr:hypothetical protein SAMN05192553_10798 [Cyclobacterium xiamenense]
MFYLRQPEDTIKGQMYYDLGFDDWVVEIGQTEGYQIADRRMEIWADYKEAKRKLTKSMEKIDRIYRKSTDRIPKIRA